MKKNQVHERAPQVHFRRTKNRAPEISIYKALYWEVFRNIEDKWMYGFPIAQVQLGRDGGGVMYDYKAYKEDIITKTNTFKNKCIHFA